MSLNSRLESDDKKNGEAGPDMSDHKGGTSLMRNCPPQETQLDPEIVLLQGPGVGVVSCDRGSSVFLSSWPLWGCDDGGRAG